MPRKSVASRKLPEPMSLSWPVAMSWMAGCRLSGPATLLTGSDNDMDRPVRTSEAALRTCSGVMSSRVARVSSGPQSPQFLSESNSRSNSATDHLRTSPTTWAIADSIHARELPSSPCLPREARQLSRQEQGSATGNACGLRLGAEHCIIIGYADKRVADDESAEGCPRVGLHRDTQTVRAHPRGSSRWACRWRLL